MVDPIDKNELTKELAAARVRLVGHAAALRHDLNLGARLQASVGAKPRTWFVASAIPGYFLSRVAPTRRKVVVKEPALRDGQVGKAGKAAMLSTVLKMVLDFAKPALFAWATQRYHSRFDQRYVVRPQSLPDG